MQNKMSLFTAGESAGEIEYQPAHGFAWILDVHHRSPLKKLLAIALGWLIVLIFSSVLSTQQVLAAGNFNLPDLGEPASASLSELQEQQLGRRFMSRLRRTQPIIEDPAINTYINDIGHRLASFSAHADATYTFFVIEQKTLNAFAAPGGYIGINSGLILAAEDESELGGVLAHEISHATQKHLARLIARSKEVSLPAAAALVGAILLGGQAGAAAVVAANAAVLSDRLAYTREFEREADALGIRTLHAAGLDPSGMVRFFDKMQRWARVQELKVPEFLRTHPLTANRISEVQSRLRQLPAKPSSNATNRPLYYPLIRARVRALYSQQPRQALAYFDAELALLATQRANQSDAVTASSKDIALRYGRALAMTQIGNVSESVKILESLLDIQIYSDDQKRTNHVISREGPVDDIARVLFLKALTDAWRKNRQYESALSTLDRLEEFKQNAATDTSVQAIRARIYLEQGETTKALSLSRALSRQQNNNPGIQKLYAQISAQADEQAESHEAMAMYHYLRDNFSAALDQLFAARNLVADDYYANARIEARIEEVQREKRLLQSSQ